MLFEGLAALQIMTGDGSSLQHVRAAPTTNVHAVSPRVSGSVHRDTCGTAVGDERR